MSSITFQFRYETGLCFKDVVVENIAEYRSKKLDAMRLVMHLVHKESNRDANLLGGYVHDRCLNLTRWYDLLNQDWGRKQPTSDTEKRPVSQDLFYPTTGV